MRKYIALALVGGIFLIQYLAAQTTGGFTGRLRDETAAVIPNAEVTILNMETGITRAVRTDKEGVYLSPGWSPGNYEIGVQVQGFQAEKRPGITLAVGQQAVVDFVLRVGAVTESVVVTGELGVVETTTATISGVMQERTVRELPLNGRSFTDLMSLQPLVIKLASAGSTQVAEGFGAKFAVAGSRFDQINYLLDGLNVNDAQNATPGSVAGVMLGTDTIREFRLLAGNFGAQYGRVSGGVMVAVTQSGTNTLHGSAFEFLRNSALDARSFFDRDPTNPLQRSDPPPFKRNQFGFTVGGPIRKDRTFFFGSYEGLRQRLLNTRIVSVPTVAARQGILPTGTFPVTPAAQGVLNLFPLPTPGGRDLGNGAADYIYAASLPVNENFFAVKVDHNLSDQHLFFARYSLDDGSSSAPNDVPVTGVRNETLNQYAVIEGTSFLSPTFLNAARIGFNRSITKVNPALLAPPAALDPITFIKDGRGPGNITVSGFFSIGTTSTTPREFTLNSYQFEDQITWSRGKHALKIGGFLQRDQDNLHTEFVSRGTYTFTSITGLYANQPVSLLCWAPGSEARRGWRQSIFGGYLQDDIRLSSRLTLNLGVRYEAVSAPTEVNGKVATLPRPFLDPSATVADKLFENPSLKNFAPRVGIAWDPFGDGKTSVRAGWGIYHQTLVDNFWRLPAYLMPPFTTVSLISGGAGPIFPDAFANFTGQTIATRPDAIDVHLNQPYKLNYSFDIQREIFPDTAVTIGYVGSRGIHLMNTWGDINSPPSFLDPSTGRVTIPRGSARRNPAFSQVRFRATDNNSFYNALQLSMNKRFRHGFQFQGAYTWSKSIDYNSLVVSSGTDYDVIAIDSPIAFNNLYNRGISNYNIGQFFVTNYVWELPVGPGRKFGANARGVGGNLLEGWALNGVITVSSGPPFTATLAFDNAGALPQTAGGGQRPDLNPGASNNPVLGSPDRYFDTNGFSLPPAGTFGTLGRNTLEAPGLVNLDFSIAKNSSLTERIKLQFRAEFFNILNRANFKIPATDVFVAGGRLNPSAGRITSVATSPRQIQFALKFTF